MANPPALLLPWFLTVSLTRTLVVPDFATVTAVGAEINAADSDRGRAPVVSFFALGDGVARIGYGDHIIAAEETLGIGQFVCIVPLVGLDTPAARPATLRLHRYMSLSAS